MVVRNSVRTRPDEGHIAQEHVQKLWQFIDARASNEATYRGDPFVALSGLMQSPIRRLLVHRPEFVDAKGATAKTSAPLAEKGRAWRTQPDRYCDARQDRQQQEKCCGGENQIDEALQRTTHWRGREPVVVVCARVKRVYESRRPSHHSGMACARRVVA